MKTNIVTDKYQNKYRIESTRLQNWDYGWIAAYFVTICTQKMVCYFGHVVETPKLGNHIVMPNHVHGIIIIDKPDDGHNNERNVETPNVETPKLGVSTTKTTGGKNEKWKPGTLGVIMNQNKRICTINARQINPDFAWQPRFHDHIIRDDKSYQNISEYIFNNPLA